MIPLLYLILASTSPIPPPLTWEQVAQVAPITPEQVRGGEQRQQCEEKCRNAYRTTANACPAAPEEQHTACLEGAFAARDACLGRCK